MKVAHYFHMVKIVRRLWQQVTLLFCFSFLDSLASYSAFALSSFVSVTWLYLEYQMVLVSR